MIERLLKSSRSALPERLQGRGDKASRRSFGVWAGENRWVDGILQGKVVTRKGEGDLKSVTLKSLGGKSGISEREGSSCGGRPKGAVRIRRGRNVTLVVGTAIIALGSAAGRGDSFVRLNGTALGGRRGSEPLNRRKKVFDSTAGGQRGEVLHLCDFWVRVGGV